MYFLPTPRSVEYKDGVLLLENGKLQITERISADLKLPESYLLTVDGSGVLIEGADEAGLYYGRLTLSQLQYNYKGYLPFIKITDYPEYSYRGFMIDSCRHFFTVDEIKLMINAAAMFKFNKFHFHLSDDQGFRIEIDSFPLLTSVGSVRKGSHFNKDDDNNIEYGGYYTKAQLKEIVEYCRERHIEVIPEIDLPGHTTAIIAAYPQLSCTGKKQDLKMRGGIFDDILCAGNPETMVLIKALLDELCEIFPGEYIHIGGDEAPKVRWENCPKCTERLHTLGLENYEQLQCAMLNEIADYLKEKGKKAICWNDALKGGNLSDDNITVALWMDKKNITAKWANSGRPVIVETFTPYYADYPYGMHPLKNVYKYNPAKARGFNKKGAESVIGVESPIWTEHVTTIERMMYMCFPRWFAVAQTGWCGKNGSDNYTGFLKNVKFYRDILREYGITCAPEKVWDVSPAARLSQTAGFFLNAATKENILNLFKREEKNNENE